MANSHIERQALLQEPLLDKNKLPIEYTIIAHIIAALVKAHEQGTLHQCQHEHEKALKRAGMEKSQIKKIVKNIENDKYNIFSPRKNQKELD